MKWRAHDRLEPCIQYCTYSTKNVVPCRGRRWAGAGTATPTIPSRPALLSPSAWANHIILFNHFPRISRVYPTTGLRSIPATKDKGPTGTLTGDPRGANSRTLVGGEPWGGVREEVRRGTGGTDGTDNACAQSLWLLSILAITESLCITQHISHFVTHRESHRRHRRCSRDDAMGRLDG